MNIYRSQGFTLIELLMVVSILSATAYVALNTLESDTNQIRYKDTENRLVTVRNALLGQQGSVYNGQRLLSGYVADNGALPPRCDTNEDGNSDDADDYALCVTNALLVKPENYEGFENQLPRFDSNPDPVTGINDEAGIDITDAQYQLLKGYRSSGYLSLKPGVDDYLDGWGNGWNSESLPLSVEGDVTSLTFISLGQNNLVETDTNGDTLITEADSLRLYDPEISQEVDKSEWQVDVAGWEVSVTNVSGVDVRMPSVPDLAPTNCLRASLLVYINGASDPESDDKRWKRVTSECLSYVPIPTAEVNSCLDGDGDGDGDGDPLVSDVNLTCPSTGKLVFPPTSVTDPTSFIPQGEHLLVLVYDTSNDVSHDGATESLGSFEYDAVIPPAVQPTTCSIGGSEVIGQRVSFYSGAARPSVDLKLQCASAP